jgi:hypothetical protein
VDASRAQVVRARVRLPATSRGTPDASGSIMRPLRLVTCALLLAACGPQPTVVAPRGGPRGLHGNEHLSVANQHDELARQDSSFPEVRERGPGSLDNGATAMPWLRSWNVAGDHARMAQIHRGEAAAIQAEFDEACASRTAADIAISPLERYGLSGSNIENGVVMYLAVTAGPPEKLLADMRCHRAWMLMSPPAGMENCPLDLPGIAVEAKGDREGISVTIVESNPSMVAELQRRAAHDLETAARLRTKP